MGAEFGQFPLSAANGWNQVDSAHAAFMPNEGDVSSIGRPGGTALRRGMIGQPKRRPATLNEPDVDIGLACFSAVPDIDDLAAIG